VAGDLIRELLRVWDELDARRALPEELYVAELGVGNGSQARTWLDTFTELDRLHGRDYYRRLHYLMGDYSAHVLERARKAVAHHGDKVSTLVLDATRPQQTLAFLRGKAFCVYISNVYDNLPTDDVASIRGHPYLVEVRACLRRTDAARIARRYHTRPGELAALVHRLLRLGPDLLAEAAPGRFPATGDAVAFWQDTWSALRQQERYVPLDGLDAYQVTQAITGEILRPLLESCGDVRMHVSNGALASFAGTLPLLHPFGRPRCARSALPGGDCGTEGGGHGGHDDRRGGDHRGPAVAAKNHRRRLRPSSWSGSSDGGSSSAAASPACAGPRGPNPGMKSAAEPACPSSAAPVGGAVAVMAGAAPSWSASGRLPGAGAAPAHGPAGSAGGTGPAASRPPATRRSSQSAPEASGRASASLRSRPLITGQSGPARLGRSG
jgi:hypothetical protein